MKKYLIGAVCALLLNACNSMNSNNNTQMYGEIKGGVQSSKTF